MRNQATAEEDRASGVNSTAPWRVISAEALPEYRLKVRFRDGLEGTVDLSRLISGERAGVFAALQDLTLFKQVQIECGAVTWPGGLDLAPDAMHDAIQKQGVWVPE